ncbi:MAG: flagellar basal-body rod protein FlgG [Proteobacteria bacterium]|nr:flagellar basal-body rod protein FlgG [Pseudomonadota bacterium]
MRALTIAASGMLAQQLNVEVISNNIANLSTTGFKRQRAEFSDLLYQNQTRVGVSSSSADTVVPTGIQLGLGVRPAGTYRINEQGPLQQTGNSLDIAVNGRGYFLVTLPNNDTAYTRAGTFQRNQDGLIVTAEGYEVSPAITIPQDATDVTINEQGQVYATIDNQVNPQLLGQLDMAVFVNESGLQAIGNNLFLETQASGPAVQGFGGDPGFGSLRQRFLEASNVDAVNEITSLITAQRNYELNSNVIRSGDEMQKTVSQLS